MVSNRTVFHVVPYNDGWQIKREGRQVFEFPTKQEAIEKGEAEAHLAHPSQLLIHNQDGTIADERTYDADPFPPRG